MVSAPQPPVYAVLLNEKGEDITAITSQQEALWFSNIQDFSKVMKLKDGDYVYKGAVTNSGRPIYQKQADQGLILQNAGTDQGVIPRLYDRNGAFIDNASIATLSVLQVAGGWPTEVTFEQTTYSYDPDRTRTTGTPSYIDLSQG